MKDFYHNLPVLVTGGAGFIGSHLTEKLVTLGAQVTVMDNLETGYLHNLESVIDKIIFLNSTITDMQACKRATKNKKIVFHLAAFVSVPASVENPYACHETNVNGTFNLLESCRLNNVDRFIFSSSAAVYGPREEICSEEMPCNPTSPYGTSKLIGELLCKQYAQNYNLKTVSLRYFNVFGERQNPEGAYAAVIAKFTQQMHQNKPIIIFGNGLQTRDFISVDQVVDANLLLGMQEKKYLNGCSFNIATGSSITLLELIEQLKCKFPNYNTEPMFQPARSGDIAKSKADIKKYKTILSKRKEDQNKISL